MPSHFYEELVKQSRLEEMYQIFRSREDATEMNTALRLARFAEAHVYNAAEKRISELENVIKSLKRDK